MKKDIRLYYYDHGTLKKWGRLKKHAFQQHFFENDEDCVEYIYENILPKRFKGLQNTFVVVEYTNPYESEIICLVNKNKVVYL